MLNIEYDTDLTQFALVKSYDVFRYEGDLFMKLPELTLYRKVYIDGFNHPENFEFRKIEYNAIKLKAADADDAYVSFAPSCKVQALECKLVIKD